MTQDRKGIDGRDQELREVLARPINNAQEAASVRARLRLLRGEFERVLIKSDMNNASKEHVVAALRSIDTKTTSLDALHPLTLEEDGSMAPDACLTLKAKMSMPDVSDAEVSSSTSSRWDKEDF